MICRNCGHSWEPTLCKYCEKGHARLVCEYDDDEHQDWKCDWCGVKFYINTEFQKLPSFAVGYRCPKCRLDHSGYASVARLPKSSSGCFLTSACVDYLGKPDNCPELQTLRKFRDNYVANTENGKALIDEYYRIAPAIVEKINSSPNQEKYYVTIYENIVKCIEHIESENFENALTIYSEMVKYFQKEFSET